jgi:hypothetical protein
MATAQNIAAIEGYLLKVVKNISKRHSQVKKFLFTQSVQNYNFRTCSTVFIGLYSRFFRLSAGFRRPASSASFEAYHQGARELPVLSPCTAPLPML